MIFQRLRVFVSSKMQELAPERQALKAALDALKVDAWVFEQDAGARPISIEKAFLEEVETADLYIGLFWKGYGDYTIEEYEHACKLGKDCLIYEKRAALDGQRDPRLQAFLDRLGNVETGLTIKWFDDPLQLSEAIKDDVARWQARIIRERTTPRINVNLSLAEKKERDELLILLRKAKEFWVEGVLEKSVHGQALIDLGKEAWSEHTEHPWERVLELPDQTSRTLRPEEPIDKIFADVGRSLLILGAPGAGKTITLLTLARELIRRAESDPAQPIPVVFNLSSWTDPKKKLLVWLIDELLAKYQVPKKIGTRWLEANWIVPLLDGLDEVTTANQAACVNAINAYVQNNGAPGFAVCSRLKEYADLPVRLQVTGAICLQPLTPKQVKDYVARSGNALAGLSAALDKDPVLQTMAETPLMLDVMTLAYRDLPAEEFASGTINTEEDRRRHLFGTYIGKMFSRKGKGTQPYPKVETIGWLSWLARGMQQHGQTVFLIEQLQPTWLTTRGQRIFYILGSRMLFGLILGLIYGLTDGLIYGVKEVLKREPTDVLTEDLIELLLYASKMGLIGGLIFGLVPGLIDERRANRSPFWASIEKVPPFWQTVIVVCFYGLSIGLPLVLIAKAHFGITFGLIIGLFWGLRSRYWSLTSDIQIVETLRWSWRYARTGYVNGMILGVVLGTIFLIVNVQRGQIDRGRLSLGLLAGLINGLGYGALWAGPICALFCGLRRSILKIKSIPNLGIKLSLRSALFAGGLGLLVLIPIFYVSFGLLFAMVLGFKSALLLGLESGLYYGPILGLIAFLWYGGQDVIQHYILRCIFYWKSHAPLRYANFLDYAARVVLLQKVGGGYIFIHRMLLEHFAAMREQSAPISRDLL